MNLSQIKKLAEDGLEEMVEIRRHLHRHPELSYQEHETTRFIVEKLDKLGIQVERPLETGCVGIIDGKKNSGKVVALRADIDALPIQEQGEAKTKFLSENHGVAHCCGHDSHTANLLGTADILMECREELDGTILLIFQPGEEKLPGGGRLLCESGFLQEQGVDVIYGLHSAPFIPPGEIALRKGPMMARPDEFEIELIGKGGHASAPHQTVDPIVMAAEAITQMQTIVSRSVDPVDPTVVTVGKVEGGSTHNIIPERVALKGTVRTFSKDTSDLIKKRIEEILEGITRGNNASYNFQFNEGYPAVINPPEVADVVVNAASDLIGLKNVHMMDAPVLAGEDFAFYQQEFPGAFFALGSGSEWSDSQWGWHHPKYNIDEECFKTGAALMAWLAFQEIPSST
jgi:amidohydrolase